ncbi:pyridoxal phosphate-dependent aminotransferase [Burkholderia ubonensis]|nr:pyridoxal phosphate-dependent aminotransferase [Burkholderia ubonensis]
MCCSSTHSIASPLHAAHCRLATRIEAHPTAPDIPMPIVNQTIAAMQEYASKAISAVAKADPSIVNLSIGEPDFGPPPRLLDAIANEDLGLSAFLSSAKHYETTRGAKALRSAVASWYARRHDLDVDPEREILITHGGVEAVAVALLGTTVPGDAVGVTDPSYMLYKRAITTLGRVVLTMPRPPQENEFCALLEQRTPDRMRALVVNSPENPSGYVLTDADWDAVATLAEASDAWVIHDEVYDALDFGRPHRPAWCTPRLRDRTIMINSFSKKFGVPGLRIGWMVAPEQVIDLAGKAHDYLILGVNAQYERIARRLLEDPEADRWLASNRDMIRTRASRGLETLHAAGFEWSRRPQGGMFLFPSVRRLHAQLPVDWRNRYRSAGEAVAAFLLKERRVAVVPGSVYGESVADHVRLVLCASDAAFDEGLARLTAGPT